MPGFHYYNPKRTETIPYLVVLVLEFNPLVRHNVEDGPHGLHNVVEHHRLAF